MLSYGNCRNIIAKSKKMIKHNACKHNKYKNPKKSGLPKCNDLTCYGYYSELEWEHYCNINNLKHR